MESLRKLISKWRMIELQSWNSLLRGKECAYAKKALRHWFSLFEILTKDAQCLRLTGDKHVTLVWGDMLKSCDPWLKWYITKMMVYGASNEQGNYLKSVFEALDGFLRSAVVGEFPTRLHLVRFLALELQSRHSGSLEMKLANLVTGLWEYYSLFLPTVRVFQDKLRNLIDGKVNDTVKLAKWDSVNTYSLLDSSERVHRSLNKHLREYETDVLDYPFALLLRKSLIGNFVSEQGELIPVTDLPSFEELFPHACTDQTPELAFFRSERVENESDAPASITLPPRLIHASKILNRFHYILETVLNIQITDDSQVKARPAHRASVTCEALCSELFERIASLKNLKAPKAIKYRAIHDMFDTLRDEGFSHLRSDVVSEMRNFEHLLSTPWVFSKEKLADLSGTNADVLRRSEEYFSRNIAELNQFVTQMNSPFSKDISTRDIQLMIGFSENMLQKV